MPVEVIVLVYRNMDSIRDVLNLASACHLLSSVWKIDTYEILHKVLSRQLLSYDMAKELFGTQFCRLAFQTMSQIPRRLRDRYEKEVVKVLQGFQPVTGYFLDKEKGALWFYTLEIQPIIDQHFLDGTPWGHVWVYYFARLCILGCFFPRTRESIEV